MKPKTVKRIFLFFIIYLPFQYLLVGIIGGMYSEPWPAFVMPGFKSIYATENNVEIIEPSFIALSEKNPQQNVEIEASSLFEGVPESQLQGFLRSNFQTQRDFSPETNQWLNERVEQLYPGRSFLGLQVQWTAIYYSQDGSNVSIVEGERIQTFTIPFGID